MAEIQNNPEEFIDKAAIKLHQKGFITERELFLPGLTGLLYARSPEAFQLGFARVEDHWLFLDWENAVFGRKELLIKAFQSFSKFVNQKFPVPHSLRMKIPNLAVIAVSQSEFPEEIIQYVEATYLNPWYGGEVGQILLVNLGKRDIFYHRLPRTRQPGAFPLGHTIDVLLETCRQAFL
jgi:hypothetical protein